MRTTLGMDTEGCVGLFKKQVTPPVRHVDGDRASVPVIGLGYKRADLPRAFGQLGRLSEYDFEAVLAPRQPNEYNPTPIEVWVNGVHIGYVNDRQSPKYWASLRAMTGFVSAGCVVKTDGLSSASRVWLSLPLSL